jgi:hypothetical protein
MGKFAQPQRQSSVGDFDVSNNVAKMAKSFGTF